MDTHSNRNNVSNSESMAVVIGKETDMDARDNLRMQRLCDGTSQEDLWFMHVDSNLSTCRRKYEKVFKGDVGKQPTFQDESKHEVHPCN